MGKICMLTTGHSPKDDRIFFKEAKTLQNAGYDIHILCISGENGIVKDLSSAIINTSNDQDFILDNIHIHVIKKNETYVEKVLKKFFLAAYQKKAIQKAIQINAEVYHTHEEESFYLGYQTTKKLKHSKLVLDAHESWVNRGIKNWYLKKTLIPKLNYLITANDITRGYLLSLNSKIKAEVIFNASIFSQKSDSVKRNDTVFKIVHEGSLKFNRGLKLMLDAAKILSDKGVNYELHLIGSIPKEEKGYIEKFLEEHKLQEYVKIRGLFKYEELSQILTGFDLGLIVSTFDSNNLLAGPPNKLFNYVASGYPVLSVDLPETSKFIRKYDVGQILSNRTPKELAEQLNTIINDENLLAKLRSNVLKNQSAFSWDIQGRKLLNFYKSYLIPKRTQG